MATFVTQEGDLWVDWRCPSVLTAVTRRSTHAYNMRPHCPHLTPLSFLSLRSQDTGTEVLGQYLKGDRKWSAVLDKPCLVTFPLRPCEIWWMNFLTVDSTFKPHGSGCPGGSERLQALSFLSLHSSGFQCHSNCYSYDPRGSQNPLLCIHLTSVNWSDFWELCHIELLENTVHVCASRLWQFSRFCTVIVGYMTQCFAKLNFFFRGSGAQYMRCQ